MNKNEKFKNAILKYDLIYCDTCIAMHKEFENFVNRFGGIFKKHRKKITIIQEVYNELNKFASIGSDSQKYYATKAIELINSNSGIFEIENKKAANNLLMADSKLLSRLIDNMIGKSQMLLTNDGGLASDAKDFNSLYSVNGKPIGIYRINQYGEVSEFKNNNVQEPKQEIKYIEKVVEKPVIKYVKEKSSPIDTLLKPALSIIGTYLVINNKDKLISLVNDFVHKL